MVAREMISISIKDIELVKKGRWYHRQAHEWRSSDLEHKYYHSSV